MTKLKQIKRAVAGLSDADLTHFRDWLEAYDVRRFERRVRENIAAGELEKVADAALARANAHATRLRQGIIELLSHSP